LKKGKEARTKETDKKSGPPRMLQTKLKLSSIPDANQLAEKAEKLKSSVDDPLADITRKAATARARSPKIGHSSGRQPRSRSRSGSYGGSYSSLLSSRHHKQRHRSLSRSGSRSRMKSHSRSLSGHKHYSCSPRRRRRSRSPYHSRSPSHSHPPRSRRRHSPRSSPHSRRHSDDFQETKVRSRPRHHYDREDGNAEVIEFSDDDKLASDGPRLPGEPVERAKSLERSDSPPRRGKKQKHKWTVNEEKILKAAVQKWGKLWSKIHKEHGEIFQGRSQVDLKDKWRNMTKKKSFRESDGSVVDPVDDVED